MSYKTIISNSKKIESLLVKLGAEGRGMGSYGRNIESTLISINIKMKDFYFITKVRNNLVHKEGFEISSDMLISYKNKSTDIIGKLENEIYRDKRTKKQIKKNFKANSSWKKSLMGVIAFLFITLVVMKIIG